MTDFGLFALLQQPLDMGNEIKKLSDRAPDDRLRIQQKVLRVLRLRLLEEVFKCGVLAGLHGREVVVHVFDHHDVVVERGFVVGVE